MVKTSAQVSDSQLYPRRLRFKLDGIPTRNSVHQVQERNFLLSRQLVLVFNFEQGECRFPPVRDENRTLRCSPFGRANIPGELTTRIGVQGHPEAPNQRIFVRYDIQGVSQVTLASTTSAPLAVERRALSGQ